MKRAVLFMLLLGGCALSPDGEPASDVHARSEAIVGGEFERGRPEVVFLYQITGAACTGSIISPYVVLTANHCVESGGRPAPPSNFRIYIGSSTRALTAEYRVAEVRPVPNAGLGMREANDVALLVLATPATEPPIELGRGAPRASLSGRTLTAVGYGQTPAGGSGTKYFVDTRLNGYQNGFIFVPPTVCSGDSGGPLLGDDGAVYGVASFIFSPDGRTQPVCGTAPGAYNEIFRHLDFIDSVLEETGSCVPDPSGEVCNGLDDNCDGEVDEGCIAIGQPCTSSDECVGGLCADTAVGRICTSQCDGLRPDQGCSPGFYCAKTDGCDGYCVSGSAGTGDNDSDCTQNTDCFSLFCHDPGDGRRRCLDPCRADAGSCFAGEVCPAAPGSCSGCVPGDLVSFPRGLGEPCEEDIDCRGEMVCAEHSGVRECSRACTDEDGCGDGFECRDGMCRVDRRQGVGGVCVDNPDCGDGICAAIGDRLWCTAPCASAEDCPSGFICQDAGGTSVCAPEAGLDGEPCAANDDCASGLCAESGGEAFCTSYCDRATACAPGFECRRAGGGTAVCVVASANDGGCSVSPAGSRSALPFGLVGLGLLTAFWRRRRAR